MPESAALVLAPLAVRVPFWSVRAPAPDVWRTMFAARVPPPKSTSASVVYS